MRPHVRTFSAVAVALAVAVPGTAEATGLDPAPAAAKPLPALTPAVPDALTRALTGGRIDEATYALERVASLFSPGEVRARYGHVASAEPRDATLLLRDLAARSHELHGEERRRADTLLARPTDGAPDDPDGYTVPEETPECSEVVCVHHVASTKDRPPGLGWVTTTLEVLGEVWDQEVGAYGYRAPRSDMRSKNDGGDGRLDVYLADVGSAGVFGYCTTDDPRRLSRFDVSAYCVLDNDFDPAQFGYDPVRPNYPDPLDLLRVTAAHEFHHAVQFGYDYLEDAWIMEASSTWIEDEVYDDVDDNVLYLRTSPLRQPHVPLDKGVSPRWYGAWIFLRFLSEYVGMHDGVGPRDPDPTIVRSIWSKLDAAEGRPDLYSTKGVVRAIAARTLDGAAGDMQRVFADFAVWNARPVHFYDEGAFYPPVRPAARGRLTSSAPAFGSTFRVDHLANRFLVLKRGIGLPSGARLRIRVDGPDAVSDPAAGVVVVGKDGSVTVRRIGLDGAGRGAMRVAFGSSIARVTVIVTNASTRYRACWTGDTKYACFGGVPVDDGRSFQVRAAVL